MASSENQFENVYTKKSYSRFKEYKYSSSGVFDFLALFVSYHQSMVNNMQARSQVI